MDILEKTSNKLVCGTKPSSPFSLSRLFFAALFWFMAYGILGLSGVQELVCKRVEPTQVNCKLTQSRFMGLVNEQVISLSDVKKARIDTTTRTVTDDEGNTSTEKSSEVVLVYSNNEISLSGKHLEDASKVNAFIKHNSSTYLNIKNDDRLSNLGILSILGIFLVILSKLGTIKHLETTTYIFDKNIGKLTIQQQRLVGLGYKITKVREYPLLEIIDVLVETKTDSDGDFRSCHVSLSLTENNGQIFLSSFYVETQAQEFASTIERFLNLQKKC